MLMKSKSEISRIRDYQSGVFESWDTSLEVKDDPRLSKVVGNLVNLPPGRMLDVGCGYGKLSVYLIKRGWQAVGVDIVSGPLQSLAGKGVQAVRGDFQSTLPLQDQAFDMAFAGEVIEHTTSEREFVSELARILKPGGTLIVTTPNLVSLRNRLYMLLGKMPLNAAGEFHYRVFTLNRLRRLLESYGLQVQTIESSYLLFFVHGTGFLHRILPAALKSLGQRLGSVFPSLGDHLIVFARKRSPVV